MIEVLITHHDGRQERRTWNASTAQISAAREVTACSRPYGLESVEILGYQPVVEG